MCKFKHITQKISEPKQPTDDRTTWPKSPWMVLSTYKERRKSIGPISHSCANLRQTTGTTVAALAIGAIFRRIWALFFCRKSLFWAQISIFDTKILRFSFFRWNVGKRAWVQGSVEPKISNNGPLQRPTGRFECFSLFSVIFCFFEYVIFVDYFLQILRVLHLRTPNSKAMVCIGTVYSALRRMHVATCSLNKKCFKKHQMTAQETTNKTQIDL